jgi:chemotaxis protein CheD
VNTVVVKIAGYTVSSNPDDQLTTYALGSCVAVIAHDPTCGVGGMIHIMLPLSTLNPEKAAANPAMFADTGLPLLFKALHDKGCRRDGLVVKVAGGATMIDVNEHFDVGNRNITTVRRLLWKARILIAAEALGGREPRTVALDVGTGRCIIRSKGETLEL